MNVKEYIDEYVAGTLSGELRQQFEAAMKTDIELKKMVDEYKEIHLTAEGMGELALLEEVEAVAFENDAHENNTLDDQIGSKGKSKYILLALSFLISFLVAYFVMQFLIKKTNKNSEPAQIFAEVYREPIWPIERSENPDMLQKGISAYLGGDLDMAKKVLLDSVEDQKIGRYWMAEVFAKEGEMDSVVYYLQGSTISREDAQFERRCYLEALGLVLKGDQDGAKSVLNRIGNERSRGILKRQLGID